MSDADTSPLEQEIEELTFGASETPKKQRVCTEQTIIRHKTLSRIYAYIQGVICWGDGGGVQPTPLHCST